MSHVKSHTRVTASGKTVFVREHLTSRVAEIPSEETMSKDYEGPYHAVVDGKAVIKYRVKVGKSTLSLKQHPEDDFSETLARHERNATDLASGKMTPRQMIGTGYNNPRKVATQYVKDQIERGRAELEEVRAKKIPRYNGAPLADPEKPKKEVQHRVSKEAADHLFGKDGKAKPTASERGMVRHKNMSSVFKKSAIIDNLEESAKETGEAADKKASGGITKSHVKQHMRTTKSGKVVAVREHEDTRQAHRASRAANVASREAEAKGTKEAHLAAAKAHHEAFKAHRDARDNHKGEDVAGNHFGHMANHVAKDRKHLTAAGVDQWDQPHYHEPEKKGKNENPDFQ